ncbi:MAG TPA: helix-turn-helix transcriptional regulator [Acholeplasmataceae bacterium]|jgi:DNA-binding XRE family transcriptional regulator|nr:helix-turn-helix transcriptional regulator [Acholeplasmataceae bacterium]
MKPDYLGYSNKRNKLSLKLLEERKKLNITQKEMAQKINLSYSIYSAFERGQYKANLMILSRVSKYLKISMKEAEELHLTI